MLTIPIDFFLLSMISYFEGETSKNYSVYIQNFKEIWGLKAAYEKQEETSISSLSSFQRFLK